MIGIRRRLIILAYHRVLQQTDDLVPDQTDEVSFHEQAKALTRYFNVVPLSKGVLQLREGTLPPRAVAITFDDGYRDNREIALPILEKYGLTATFYVATGFLNGGRMWNDTVIELIRRCPDEILNLSRWQLGTWPLKSLSDRRVAMSNVIAKLKYRARDERNLCVDEIEAAAGLQLPNDLMMDTSDVQFLHTRGMEIGAHTVRHPILAKVDSATAYEEISNSKTVIEEMLNDKISSFAYPNGRPGKDYGATHVEIVRELGFQNAVSTLHGCADENSPAFELPRIGVWDRTQAKFALRMILKSYA